MLKISAQPQFIQQMSVQYVGMLLEFKSSEQKEQSLKTSKWKSCRDYTWEKYIVEKSFIFLNIVSQNVFFLFLFFNLRSAKNWENNFIEAAIIDCLGIAG